MTDRRRGGPRTPPALLLATLLAAPFVAAQTQVEEFAILPLGTLTLPPGGGGTVEVEAQHFCPAVGDVYFFAGPGEGLTTDIGDARFGPCEADDYAYARTSAHVGVRPDARAGVTGVAIGALYDGKQAACKGEEGTGCPLRVDVRYVGRLQASAPETRAMFPGKGTSLTIRVTSSANDGTWARVVPEVPPGWDVEGPASLHLPYGKGEVSADWPAEVTPPGDATGDVPLVFHVLAVDATTRSQEAEPATVTVLAQLPGRTSSEDDAEPPTTDPPASSAGSSPTFEDEDAAAPPRSPPSKEVPEWLVLAGIGLAAVAALWFTRRR